MSKADILGNIRRGLGRGADDQAARQSVLSRIEQRKANLIPKRGQLPRGEQVALFKSMAEEASAVLISVEYETEIAAVCSTLLREKGIKKLIVADEESINQQNWPDDIQIEHRPCQIGDEASLTASFAGIAETGTLMLHSKANSPTTLNFLPDHHFVILRKSDIVGVYEEAWKKLREQTQGAMPRTVNMITGPSRSADIEQKLQMGAHGPKDLYIVLLENS